MPEPEKRTHMFRVLVRPSSAKAFQAECDERDVTVSEAMREGMNLWILEQRRRRGSRA